MTYNKQKLRFMAALLLIALNLMLPLALVEASAYEVDKDNSTVSDGTRDYPYAISYEDGYCYIVITLDQGDYYMALEDTNYEVEYEGLEGEYSEEAYDQTGHDMGLAVRDAVELSSYWDTYEEEVEDQYYNESDTSSQEQTDGGFPIATFIVVAGVIVLLGVAVTIFLMKKQ